MSLYETLRTAGQAADTDSQRAIAHELIDGIRRGNEDAGIHYWSLISDILENELGGAHGSTDRWDTGEFTPIESGSLVTLKNRNRRFLEAIAAAKPRNELGELIPIKTVIDAGCGSSAFLAVGAAVLHEHAKVEAYEINSVAAACARLVVGYFGLSDRIQVKEGNALTVDFDQAVLGLSETFGEAFTREPGMEMIHRLNQRTQLVIPAIGRLFVRDLPTDRPEIGNEPWQNPSTFDLTQQHEYVTGSFATSADGPRLVSVSSGLYRADNTPIVEVSRCDDDDIAYPVIIGTTPDTPRGSVFEFRYRPGQPLDDDNPVEMHQVA